MKGRPRRTLALLLALAASFAACGGQGDAQRTAGEREAGQERGERGSTAKKAPRKGGADGAATHDDAHGAGEAHESAPPPAEDSAPSVASGGTVPTVPKPPLSKYAAGLGSYLYDVSGTASYAGVNRPIDGEGRVDVSEAGRNAQQIVQRSAYEKTTYAVTLSPATPSAAAVGIVFNTMAWTASFGPRPAAPLVKFDAQPGARWEYTATSDDGCYRLDVESVVRGERRKTVGTKTVAGLLVAESSTVKSVSRGEGCRSLDVTTEREVTFRSDSVLMLEDVRRSSGSINGVDVEAETTWLLQELDPS